MDEAHAGAIAAPPAPLLLYCPATQSVTPMPCDSCITILQQSLRAHTVPAASR